MDIEYIFDNENFVYNIPINQVKQALVNLLCEKVKFKHKYIFNEDGAYQMAMYIVYDLDLLNILFKKFKKEIYTYFYDDALCEYLINKD